MGAFLIRPAVLAGLAALTLIVCIQWQQNLSVYFHTDFAAYWSAGRAVNEGWYRYSYRPVDAEGVPFAHAMFLNPPIVAHPFRLLGALPYDRAAAVWYFVQFALFTATIFLIAGTWRLGTLISIAAIIGMPFVFWPLFAELERGETNMIPLVCAAAGYALWRRRLDGAAGVLLGLGSAFKFPLLILFTVPLARRRWRVIAAGAVTFATVFLVSALIDGVPLNRVYFTKYLPVISIKDTLPDTVFPRAYTAHPPLTRWEGRTYLTRYPFQAPSGSATRFIRDLLHYRIDRSLVLGGAAVTGLAIIFGAQHRRVAAWPLREQLAWEDAAWAAAMMAALILHTLSWITNYVAFIFPAILVWQAAAGRVHTTMARWAAAGLFTGAAAIMVGDPITRAFPSPWLVTDILLRNRVWLGGTLVWGLLLVLLVTPMWWYGRGMSGQHKGE
ncbi:MAG: hypothetical protein COT71_02480 [Candidatus Andersenbacteria bacterium CG10_big_fil_rev_8_21_14_0_10_54_11]|uniref:DUF2029 domain-containing protein n=1 Tax=Candidatus Andersenbacteria bacterium CG10_big_fil_rev_8_21_14_0_10_54_11 TaxID=1974485 RepID=A0A2M6WZB7_9BACT|nr:MAG: hypothetical protein COT71_02480 [Candidatus Andersenbacteria bacterium CG10_big_fil_rev_8_21_14_0_10_54_11]